MVGGAGVTARSNYGRYTSGFRGLFIRFSILFVSWACWELSPWKICSNHREHLTTFSSRWHFSGSLALTLRRPICTQKLFNPSWVLRCPTLLRYHFAYLNISTARPAYCVFCFVEISESEAASSNLPMEESTTEPECTRRWSVYYIYPIIHGVSLRP